MIRAVLQRIAVYSLDLDTIPTLITCVYLHWSSDLLPAPSASLCAQFTDIPDLFCSLWWPLTDPYLVFLSPQTSVSPSYKLSAPTRGQKTSETDLFLTWGASNNSQRACSISGSGHGEIKTWYGTRRNESNNGIEGICWIPTSHDWTLYVERDFRRKGKRERKRKKGELTIQQLSLRVPENFSKDTDAVTDNTKKKGKEFSGKAGSTKRRRREEGKEREEEKVTKKENLPFSNCPRECRKFLKRRHRCSNWRHKEKRKRNFQEDKEALREGGGKERKGKKGEEKRRESQKERELTIQQLSSRMSESFSKEKTPML